MATLKYYKAIEPIQYHYFEYIADYYKELYTKTKTKTHRKKYYKLSVILYSAAILSRYAKFEGIAREQNIKNLEQTLLHKLKEKKYIEYSSLLFQQFYDYKRSAPKSISTHIDKLLSIARISLTYTQRITDVILKDPAKRKHGELSKCEKSRYSRISKTLLAEEYKNINDFTVISVDIFNCFDIVYEASTKKYYFEYVKDNSEAEEFLYIFLFYSDNDTLTDIQKKDILTKIYKKMLNDIIPVNLHSTLLEQKVFEILNYYKYPITRDTIKEGYTYAFSRYVDYLIKTRYNSDVAGLIDTTLLDGFTFLEEQDGVYSLKKEPVPAPVPVPVPVPVPAPVPVSVTVSVSVIKQKLNTVNQLNLSGVATKLYNKISDEIKQMEGANTDTCDANTIDEELMLLDKRVNDLIELVNKSKPTCGGFLSKKKSSKKKSSKKKSSKKKSSKKKLSKKKSSKKKLSKNKSSKKKSSKKKSSKKKSSKKTK